MQTQRNGLFASILGALMTLGVSGVALADDTDIFFNQHDNNVGANVLLILDTSGSMDDNVATSLDYNPARTYTASKCAGNFATGYVYYSSGSVPACGSTSRISTTKFTCSAATTPLANAGKYAADQFIGWGNVGTRRRPSYAWSSDVSIAGTTGYVDCNADAGVAGAGDPSNSGKIYPTKNADTSNTTGIWDNNPCNNWWGPPASSSCSQPRQSGGAYTIYTANYLNWYYDSSQNALQSKIRTMQQAADSLLDSVANVNVGLMRYSYNGSSRSGASGGMVMWPVGDVATGRASMKTLINGWAAAGNTPLSETLFEAYRYFAGGGVRFGLNSNSTLCTTWTTDADGSVHCTSANWFTQPSIATSRTPATTSGANYNSPADHSCQKNYVVYLTDGAPTTDDEADTAIKALPNFAATGAACYSSWNTMWSKMATESGGAQPNDSDGGLCTEGLAKYLYKTDLRSDVGGSQNVTTYFIGFGDDFTGNGAGASKYQYLLDAAAAGGGRAYTATSLNELTSVLSAIFSEVAKTNTLFSAPAVAVNAFNRTQTLNDLYVSVFSPAANYHWAGNVKKYKVVNNEVVDANDVGAVDTNTGFFKDSSLSYWTNASTDCVKNGTAGPDGQDVACGGGAWKIPAPATRKVYTFVGVDPSSPVSLSAGTSYSLDTSNALLTNTVMGVGGSGDPSLADLIHWARGQDVLDDNDDGSTTDTRHVMGDPIHTAPAVVIYGHNNDGTDDGVAFVTTNDGYLHAINVNTGVELWSFVPQEMLPRLKYLYENGSVTAKHYGLDGALRLLKYDVNGDGVVNAADGDKVILYFGSGRSTDTRKYFALDVTSKTAPKFMWSIGNAALPELGQTWSAPSLARVRISGATQNAQKFVLVIGGGYDPAEDGYTFLPSGDSAGAHLYIVDAISGARLWWAGASGADFNSTRMTHSIPAEVTAIDTDGDGYADRMYVGDMAGQLWRFDIWTDGTHAASTLVTGGVIASLGTKEDSTHTEAANRRFYAAVDAALIRRPGIQSFMNLSIGSGYRGHPLNVATQDRFYSIRDYDPTVALSQTDFNNKYDQSTPRTDSNSTLIDITTTVQPTVPEGSMGWKLRLDQHGGWIGEKALVPSRTFNYQVIFTTYTPNTGTVSDPCAGVGTGTNRVYVVDVLDGAPTTDRNNDGSRTIADRSIDLAQGGIAPETAFLFLGGQETGSSSGGSSSGGSSGGSGSNGGGPGGGLSCIAGVEVLPGVCANLDQRVKTYWREGAAN